MTFLILLIGGAVLYVCLAAVIASGIHTRYRRTDALPTVSVVIPARNEERTIGTLLESLLEIDYPPEQLEVVLVNDQSTDHTREIAESFRDRFRCRFEVIDVEPEHNSTLRAKTRPLAQGIDRASGELVLMPDADNRIPRSWVKCIASYFADDVGMVCGTTLPDQTRKNAPVLTSFETVDSALLLGTCAGFSGLGKTQALIGSNFAVRRSAYQQIGTYRSLNYHEIEDLSLLHALQQTGKWSAVFPADRDTLLLTMPAHSLAELIQQRRRWMGGWLRVKPAIRGALTLAILAHVAWPLMLFAPGNWFMTFYGLLVLGDSLVAARILHRYQRTHLIPLLATYPLFAATYAIPALLLMATGRRVKWKERAF